VFEHNSISRNHVQIAAVGAALLLEDLHSHNGTTANGVRCTKATLREGDVIGVGPILLVVDRAPAEYRIPQHPDLIGASYALSKVLQSIDKVARSRTAVLIRGETGTGKELVAKALHVASGRPGHIHAVNCATLSGDLLNSEIFGHTRGSFTGADRTRAGLLEAAHRGTLFLDEIGDAPIELQLSLFRFLENGEIRPVGSEKLKKVDVRIIAASNQDFGAMVQSGRFRKELYSRLKGWVLDLPPLRERVDDIPLIARHFVREFKREDTPIHGRLMAALLLYAWPENVRELKHVIERAVLEAGEEAPIPLSPYLERYLLPQRRISGGPHSAGTKQGPSGHVGAGGARPAGKPHANRLMEVLLEHAGNVRQAAAALGVSRNTFYRWLEEYAIDPTKYRGKWE
jgi:DNA-binding NtrC family response regulator